MPSLLLSSDTSCNAMCNFLLRRCLRSQCACLHRFSASFQASFSHTVKQEDILECKSLLQTLTLQLPIWGEMSEAVIARKVADELRTCVKWLHSGTTSRQSGQHQSRHGKIDKGLTTGVRPLTIAGEPAVARDPGIGAFDHPSVFEGHESLWE